MSSREPQNALMPGSNADASDAATVTATLPGPGGDREDLAYYVRHHLNRTERLVVMLHYAEELAFDEIAGVLKMAKDEVEEIHQMVVGRLKASLTEA